MVCFASMEKVAEYWKLTFFLVLYLQAVHAFTGMKERCIYIPLQNLAEQQPKMPEIQP
jgi:hypothetical protein